MNENSLLAFGQIQPPTSARTETNEMGIMDVKMPIYDFLEYEKVLRWRCYRNMAITAVGGAVIAVSATLFYLKRKGKLKANGPY